uniref:Rx N-terminal domain-containing protein n=1 Tax=Leersia perrieri TaxID=77586 RepID=A0A0D9UZH4_9ORYZ
MEAAVVSSTEGVVGILLRKLGDFLCDKYVLLAGVCHEIQELKDDLESMNACLRDLAAAGDYAQTEQTRTWMKQVREVAYDAEDCIDNYWYHRGHHYHDESLVASWLRRTVIQPLETLRAMYKLAIEVQSLKARTLKVSERRLRYKLEAPATTSPPMIAVDSPGAGRYTTYDDLDRRLPALNIDESRLVGLRSKTKAILKILEDGGGDQSAAARRKVVSIVGFGGLGKTTLAATVYNSPTVQGIQHRAFVTVSRNCDLRALLESLLKQLTQTPLMMRDPRRYCDQEMAAGDHDLLRGIETWDISQLITMCSFLLEDKRYFIVLYDLWNPVDWENLKIAFPDNDKQSRVLITTRDRHVAENCCSDLCDRVHEMEPLPIQQSRKLFFNRVFQSDECPLQHKSLEKISEEILTKCGGLPLAIVSIGGMLARTENRTPAEWSKICARLGYGLGTNAALRGMRRILSLGYHDLPYHLKACFLYLSVFREGYEIKRGPLVRRWAAEGFISGTHEWNPEEAAEKYLDEFVKRSIVTPTRVASSGVVRCCKVHDIMLEVVTAKCIQENFISFLGNSQHECNEMMVVGHDKIRRLSIHGAQKPHGADKTWEQYDDDNPLRRKKKKKKKLQTRNKDSQDIVPSINFPCARSLLMLGCIIKPLPVINFAHLKLLRVLDLEGCRWLSNQDLHDICRLALLRYLSLRDTGVSWLPKLVGRLEELMTLDIRETHIRVLPETITRLGNLKHLLAGRYRYYTRTHRVKIFEPMEAMTLPCGLGRMRSLRTISHVDVASSFSTMHELCELPWLTKLCAFNSEEGGNKWGRFAASLSKLSSSLRKLSIIHWRNGDSGLEAFMELTSPPVFLQKFYLWGRLSALPQWISHLSNLVDLSLRENFLDGEMVMEQLGRLPNLLSLKLYHQSYMGRVLHIRENLFHRLKQLIVDNLPNLDELGFQGGAPELERLTLAFLKEPVDGIVGIDKLPRLKEVEFFGHIIVDSVVEGMVAVCIAHPNRPRVYRDDRPMEDAESSS